MSLSNDIRSKLGHLRFIRDSKKTERKREMVGYEEAKKIGVLYDATSAENFELMKQYVKTVRSHQKEVLALGYIDKKVLPADRFAQYGLDFFTRKDLNWQMVPGNIIINNFIREKFDILINLDDDQCFPLRYISAVSQARFRVGRYYKKDDLCYDMMIQAKGADMKSFIREVENYLRQIRKAS